MKRIYWWLTYNRWKAGSDGAFDAVLNCLDVIDRHSGSLREIQDLRMVIKQMKETS
jgi:hypothetical protein